MGHFLSVVASDLPKCQTLIVVRVCVKASLQLKGPLKPKGGGVVGVGFRVVWGSGLFRGSRLVVQGFRGFNGSGVLVFWCSGVLVFRCSGVQVFWSFGVQGGVLGFGRTNTTRNVIWGYDSDTFSKKQCSKQLRK